MSSPLSILARMMRERLLPSVAVDLARFFVRDALVSTLDKMLDYEAVVAMSVHTEDAREETKAFVEQKKPEFRGR
jgi:enoyl-CoA hydratase/carnithine racemase